MPLLKHLLTIIKNYFPWVLLAISIIINVYLFNLEKVVYKDKIVEVPVKVATTIKEQEKVTVKPKESVQDPDLVIKNKQDLKVSLNGNVVDLKPEKQENSKKTKERKRKDKQEKVKKDIDLSFMGKRATLSMNAVNAKKRLMKKAKK